MVRLGEDPGTVEAIEQTPARMAEDNEHISEVIPTVDLKSDSNLGGGDIQKGNAILDLRKPNPILPKSIYRQKLSAKSTPLGPRVPLASHNRIKARNLPKFKKGGVDVGPVDNLGEKGKENRGALVTLSLPPKVKSPGSQKSPSVVED